MSLKSVVTGAKLCVVPLRQAAAARLSTSARHGVNYAPVPKPLQGKMKLFQIDNGLPVHIRGGPVDKMLYAVTAVVCTVGLIECFHVYYVLSYPQKKD
ncbi:cytochrome c oxidase subunit 7A2, mitochondrial-like [Macrobrachium rosenbergii]|uniref:cytochrome c oxidase subunit 7A2, mitochondrial-like n=1 Tax=Macrobrachium rosenbergii TaxID=79674 RepID=UPI0034D5199F